LAVVGGAGAADCLFSASSVMEMILPGGTRDN
jgi:hypothetical protein